MNAEEAITELEETKKRLANEAKKWLSYLESLPTPEEKQRELTRLLMQTWLEGRMHGGIHT